MKRGDLWRGFYLENTFLFSFYKLLKTFPKTSYKVTSLLTFLGLKIKKLICFLTLSTYHPYIVQNKSWPNLYKKSLLFYVQLFTFLHVRQALCTYRLIS